LISHSVFVVAALALAGSVRGVAAQTTSPWNPLVTNAVATELAERAAGEPILVTNLIISSLENYFSVVGRFVGKATVFRDSIVVEFDTLFATRVHYGGPIRATRLDSIRVGVGVGSSTSWSPVDNSNALQVERVMPVGARINLPSSRFALPHARAENDDSNWIVVTFHLTVGRPSDGDYHPDATTYAHSAKGVLASRR
jgi:hypothetical protein